VTVTIIVVVALAVDSAASTTVYADRGSLNERIALPNNKQQPSPQSFTLFRF
jgi:hypothetical protein